VILNRKKIILVAIVTFLSSPLIAWQLENADQITLAVMDFKNNTILSRYDQLERAIPEMLKTEISQFPEIVVVERNRIENILTEQALAQTGLIEKQKAQEVGRLVGAQFMITGELNKTGSTLRIDAHLIKVATGQVVGEKVSGQNEKSIEFMVKLLAKNLIHNLTGEGQRQESIRIHNYYTNWGLITMAALTVTSGILHFKYNDYYNKYHKTNEIDNFDIYYNKANQYYKSRNIMLAISGAAALTTFILWRKDQSEGNKIYATNHNSKIQQQFSMGFAMQQDNYLVILSLKF